MGYLYYTYIIQDNNNSIEQEQYAYSEYDIPKGFENHPMGIDVSHYQGKIDWDEIKK